MDVRETACPTGGGHNDPIDQARRLESSQEGPLPPLSVDPASFDWTLRRTLRRAGVRSKPSILAAPASVGAWRYSDPKGRPRRSSLAASIPGPVADAQTHRANNTDRKESRARSPLFGAFWNDVTGGAPGGRRSPHCPDFRPSLPRHSRGVVGTPLRANGKLANWRCLDKVRLL